MLSNNILFLHRSQDFIKYTAIPLNAYYQTSHYGCKFIHRAVYENINLSSFWQSYNIIIAIAHPTVFIKQSTSSERFKFLILPKNSLQPNLCNKTNNLTKTFYWKHKCHAWITHRKSKCVPSAPLFCEINWRFVLTLHRTHESAQRARCARENETRARNFWHRSDSPLSARPQHQASSESKQVRCGPRALLSCSLYLRVK